MKTTNNLNTVYAEASSEDSGETYAEISVDELAIDLGKKLGKRVEIQDGLVKVWENDCIPDETNWKSLSDEELLRLVGLVNVEELETNE